MTEPSKELLGDDTALRITLAGKVWPIPKMGIKQNRALLPLLGQHYASGLDASKTTEGIDRMSAILLIGLRRGHKDLTQEELEELPIDPNEMANAINAIAQQTKMYAPITKNGVDRPLEVTTSQTGEP